MIPLLALATIAGSVISAGVSARNADKAAQTANKQLDLQKKQIQQQANIDSANAKQEQSEKNASNASSAFNVDIQAPQDATQTQSSLSGGLSGGLGSTQSTDT